MKVIRVLQISAIVLSIIGVIYFGLNVNLQWSHITSGDAFGNILLWKRVGELAGLLNPAVILLGLATLIKHNQ